MNKLSKKAVELLNENGYKYKVKDSCILFIRQYDYVSPIVIFTISLFFAIFLYMAFYLFSLFLPAFVLMGILIHRNNRIKINKILFDLDLGRFYVENRKVLFKHISAFYLRSKFVSEYTSAHKSTSHEFQVTLGVEFSRGERYELFNFIADYKEPSKEMEEIQDYLKSLVRSVEEK